jgi:hypothetical protein
MSKASVNRFVLEVLSGAKKLGAGAKAVAVTTLGALISEILSRISV